MTPLAKAQLTKALAKPFRDQSGDILTLQTLIESRGVPVACETSDGMILYDRRKFNGMDHAQQDAYMGKLRTKVMYWCNSTEVPKCVYDHYTRERIAA